MRHRRKAVSCERGMRKEEQEMKVNATRTELAILAVVLVILIALAVWPAWWGTVFG